MNKTFFEKATFNQKIIFFLLSLLMTVFSIYLTAHYFDLKFPTTLESGSLCNINSFFNCDATTLSPLSNVAGVPISVFGVLIGLYTLLAFVFNNEEQEGTLFSILALNAVGCVALFIYSIAVLHHLCPFCTLYYIVSILALFMLYKNSDARKLDAKYAIIYTIITAIVFGATKYNVDSKIKKLALLGDSLIQMYDKLPNLGSPSTPSPYRLANAAENFTDSPIQFTIFSDFQCPACKALSPVVEKIAEKYQGKINIQYFFYPLDHNCNPNMQRPLHTLACKAAYMASCANPKDFRKIHDDIFHNQENLSDAWIDDYAKKLGVVDCMNLPATKEAVVKMINQADAFSVQSTPTTLLNGVKIEGVRLISDYYILMDELIRRAGNK